ncbi:MAG: nicotinamide riboside transporter PnuC, partial [Acutalibacteraceae bacterium]
MNKTKRLIHYFTKAEKLLWMFSVIGIIAAFFAFDRDNYITLTASLIGVTSLILSAKGNPIGQFLMIIFSVLYGFISYTFSYFGEMATYLGMTAPMAFISLISWLRNPYKGKKSEVKVNRISKKEHIFMWVMTVIVTVIFYFILANFHT